MSVRNLSRQPVIIHGRACTDSVTKRLIRKAYSGDIAVIRHDDLDELAADGLLQAGISAVVNAGQTMTGKLPTEGPLRLLERGIPIAEIEPSYFQLFNGRMELSLTKEFVLARGLRIPCVLFTREVWLSQYQKAQDSRQEQLLQFIDNTLSYAQAEKKYVLEPLSCPGIQTAVKGRHALVVARGRDHKRDLAALQAYIQRQRPVLIGVDGGADALLELGWPPNIILGDMDSVSDRALRCGAELIVHAYQGGCAPGLARLSDMGLQAVPLSSLGTSEDAALLLAYELECERLVAVGLHSHMYDFLGKGRQGMGSSMLVKMKVSDKLIDAKGIGTLGLGSLMEESAAIRSWRALSRCCLKAWKQLNL